MPDTALRFSRTGRDAALRRLRIFNRSLAAGAAAATVLLATTAAHAFPGHARRVPRPTAVSPQHPYTPRHRSRAASHVRKRAVDHPRHATTTRTATAPQTPTAAPQPVAPPASAPQPAPAPAPAAPQPVVSGGS